jgi:hypothetical protein
MLSGKGGSTLKETNRAARGNTHNEELAKVAVQPLPTVDPPAIHFSDLPLDDTNGSIAREWNFYCREVGRLLAKGQQDKWVLIKSEEIVGVWDTEEEADAVRLRLFRMQPVLLKQIRALEPIVRGGGHDRRWSS